MGNLARCVLVLVPGVIVAALATALPTAAAPLRMRPMVMRPNVMTPSATPNFGVTPFHSVSQAAANIAALGRAFQTVPPYALGFNPYARVIAAGSYGYPMSTGYPMSSGYGSSPMMYSSGYPDVSSQGYAGAGSTPATIQTVQPYGGNPSDSQKPAAGAFSSLVNAQGGLDWPLALRILPPGLETRALREHIDGAVGQVQSQSAQGKVDAALLKSATRNVDQLRDQLAAKGDFLPLSQEAVAKAKTYLRNMKDALKSLE